MRVLLDTHVLIWWLKDDPKLGPRPRSLIANGSVEVLFSAASCWEASIKHRLGKFELSGSTLFRMASDAGLIFVRIESDHLAQLENLPAFAKHNDPFDHLLIAQALVEGAALITADRHMPQYGVRCIGVR